MTLQGMYIVLALALMASGAYGMQETQLVAGRARTDGHETQLMRSARPHKNAPQFTDAEIDSAGNADFVQLDEGGNLSEDEAVASIVKSMAMYKVQILKLQTENEQLHKENQQLRTENEQPIDGHGECQMCCSLKDHIKWWCTDWGTTESVRMHWACSSKKRNVKFWCDPNGGGYHHDHHDGKMCESAKSKEQYHCKNEQTQEVIQERCAEAQDREKSFGCPATFATYSGDMGAEPFPPPPSEEEEPPSKETEPVRPLRHR